eukprot:TRINITY_DN9560_c0_g1_i1.p1 TRINITY_DN9560_c0_g1~~TRINITY_DN9560_c0_g1_i1.p1  ORF type:complete len:124 (-),score=3.46 TRINITY_DN9560_c0_g1_i1:81-452(-)
MNIQKGKGVGFSFIFLSLFVSLVAAGTCICECCLHGVCLDTRNSTFIVDSCQACNQYECYNMYEQCQSQQAFITAHCVEGATALNKALVYIILFTILVLTGLATIIEWFPHKFPRVTALFQQT